MQRIDTENNSATLPPTETGTETPGYFSNGDPGLSIPGTKISADWLNGIQEELISVMTAAGISPDKTDNAQLLASILQLIEDNAVQDADLVASIQANAIHGTVGTTAWKAAVATGADPREITSTPVEINSTGVVANATSIHIGADLLTKDASAALEITSTTKGLLLPRLTTGERDLIPSPTAGLAIHNSSTDKIQFRATGEWRTPVTPVSGLITETLAFADGYGTDTAAGLVAGRLINIQLLTSGTAATYTPTPGTRLILVDMCGGGGAATPPSDATAGNYCLGGPGSGGGSLLALVKVTAATGTYSIGAGGTVVSSVGTAGGSTTFSIGTATLTATGGTAGTASAVDNNTKTKSTINPSASTAAGSDVVFSLSTNPTIAATRGVTSTINGTNTHNLSAGARSVSAMAIRLGMQSSTLGDILSTTAPAAIWAQPQVSGTLYGMGGGGSAISGALGILYSTTYGSLLANGLLSGQAGAIRIMEYA